VTQYENPSEFHDTFNKYWLLMFRLLETRTLFTIVQCKIFIYIYKLLYATGNVLEFELRTVKLHSHNIFYIYALRITV